MSFWWKFSANCPGLIFGEKHKVAHIVCEGFSKIFVWGRFMLRIIPSQFPVLSVCMLAFFEVAFRGLKPWPPQNLYTSTYPEAEAPECLCVADAQAKQEGTGDRHLGLKMQSNISRPSKCGSGLPLPFQMNIANITVGQTPLSDHI